MKKNNFLAQSYTDAVKNYKCMLESGRLKCWDWVFITASNEEQAKAYEKQIKIRKEENKLPQTSAFVILPDVNGARIGSGGATLNILKYLYEQCGEERMFDQKILVLHSGGDAKRIPQYSSVGKLFSPVPRYSADDERITLFDDLFMLSTTLIERVGKGMMIMPGDTELIFNALQVDLKNCDAAGLSIKTGVAEGTEHGVYVSDGVSDVKKFLHKQSEAQLRQAGAVDINQEVDIDTGVVWLGKRVCKALFELICNENSLKFNQCKFDEMVNEEVCLSLYADFLYPMALESELDFYITQAPETFFSEKLAYCRKKTWEKLSHFKLSIVHLQPGQYIHFGTTREMYLLMTSEMKKYEHLEWRNCLLTNRKEASGIYNSYIGEDVQIGDAVWLEDCIVEGAAVIEKGSVLSGLHLDGQIIPDNVVMHMLKLNNGKFICRIYGLNDNPKKGADGEFIGGSLNQFIRNASVEPYEIWRSANHIIWNAQIYPLCDTEKEAIEMALLVRQIMLGEANEKQIWKWKTCERLSMMESYGQADIIWIANRQKSILNRVKIENLCEDIKNGKDIKQVLKKNRYLENAVLQELVKRADNAGFPLNMQLYLTLSMICQERGNKIDELNYLDWENKAYDIVKKVIVEEVRRKYPFNWESACLIKDEVEIKLPVRVNFCGSPSDAAPYCILHGGTMIDGTLMLKGILPIGVKCEKIKDNKIILESIDLAGKIEITDIDEIQNCNNTDDMFSLHKSCLIAVGLIPENGQEKTLEEICSSIGGGIYLSTSVQIPKGSGLGTSSIIAAGCCKALNEILAQSSEEKKIYAQVFAAEQLMSTGGGWQDQVGGLTPGVKYFSALPGTFQDIRVEYLKLSDEIKQRLDQRFALIFSGQRRLAKNVLREEMNKCILNDENVMECIAEIRKLCAIMKFYLESGDITSFAKCISKQYELIKEVDRGSSNACIEYIFDICDDLIDGKSICGAGGGGFLQVILKENVTKEQLVERIEMEFAGCGVQVWDCQLI